MAFNSKIGRLAVLLAACLLLLSVQGTAVAQTGRAVGAASGYVLGIDEDSNLVFENGSKFDLWGLEVTNAERLTEFVVGQKAICFILAVQDGVGVADCHLQARPSEQIMGKTAPNELHLFVWLAELGVANRKCSNADMKLDVLTSSRGFTYTCPESGKPYRNIRFKL